MFDSIFTMDSGAVWVAARSILPVLLLPVAVLMGVGLLMLLADWVIHLFPGVPGSAGRRRGSGRSLGALPTWRDEDYYTTDSWEDLEDNARRANKWDG